MRAVVVGGGIIGTFHAATLHQVGFDVVQLEENSVASGASVRNFGLIWVSGRRAGVELEAALRSRALWEEMGLRVPDIGFRANGSLTVALCPEERKVMEDCVSRPELSSRLTFLEPDEVLRRNPGARGALCGALWSSEDAVVEPGAVLESLRRWLGRKDRYKFLAPRRAVEIDEGLVVDQTGDRWVCDLVIVATGIAGPEIIRSELASPALRSVRLQMLSTAVYEHALTTAIGDADTMRYYPAYEPAPLHLLPPQSSVAIRYGLQLLMVQRLDGTLTIGDTHVYDSSADFALAEEPYLELLERASKILGAPVPPVTRRWSGEYSQCLDGELCYRSQILPGVWMVTGPGGRGMTCAPAIAQDTLREAGVMS